MAPEPCRDVGPRSEADGGAMDQLADIPSRSAGRAPQILPLRQQSALITELVRERLDTILPQAMRDAGLDVWLILCQEDDPDPIFKTMIPMDCWTPILSMLVFVDEGGCGAPLPDLPASPPRTSTRRLYGGQLEEKQWPALVEHPGEARPEDDRDQHRHGRLGGRRAVALSLRAAPGEAAGEIPRAPRLGREGGGALGAAR